MPKNTEERGQLSQWLAAALSRRHTKRPCRTGLALSEEAVKRLKAAKAYEGLDYAEIVDALICTHVIGYAVQLRETQGQQKDEAA